MSDHCIAKEEIRLRQRKVCNLVAEANEVANGNSEIGFDECNEALLAAGLPAMADEAEWDLILNGPQPTDPEFLRFKNQAEIEWLEILRPEMEADPKMTTAEACTALGMTWEEVEALALKRARDNLGAHQN